MKSEYSKNCCNIASQQGGIIVLMAIVSLVLIQLIALGIDVARMYIATNQKEANAEYAVQLALHEFIMLRDDNGKEFKDAYREVHSLASVSSASNNYIGGAVGWGDSKVLSFGYWDGSSFTLLGSDDYSSINSAKLTLHPVFYLSDQNLVPTAFAKVFGFRSFTTSPTAIAYIDPSRAADDKYPILLSTNS